jgi:hypothetical protein
LEPPRDARSALSFSAVFKEDAMKSRNLIGCLTLALAICLFAFAATAHAASGGPDPYGYLWTDAEPYVWNDASSGSLGPEGDDEFSSSISMGFNFEFYGQTFSSLWITTNGHVTFDGTLNPSVVCNPASDFMGFAGLWTDIDVVTPGAIYYETTGSAPNRKFVVQFDDVGAYNDLSDTATFQVVLEEATDDVVVYIQDPFSSEDSFLGIRGYNTDHYLSSECGNAVGSSSYAVRFYIPGATTTTTPPTTTTTPPTTTTTGPPPTTTTTLPGTTTSPPTTTTTIVTTTSTTTTTFDGDCDEVVDQFLADCPDEPENPDVFRTLVCVTYEDPECLEWCMDHHDNCPDIYLCYMDELCFATDDDVDDDVNDDVDDDVDDDLNDDTDDDDDWIPDDDNDDDWTLDDDTAQCISCETTSECTEAFGTGWACLEDCCEDLNEDADAGGGDDDDDDSSCCSC